MLVTQLVLYLPRNIASRSHMSIVIVKDGHLWSVRCGFIPSLVSFVHEYIQELHMGEILVKVLTEPQCHIVDLCLLYLSSS